MSSNICPRCHKTIRIPEEEVIVVRTRLGKGKTEDRMVHKVCPSSEPVAQVGGQQYCTTCGHAKSIHSSRCSYSSFDYRCDCKEFRG
ncbi:hypothetical protein E6H31_08685 [Candidatus Bathyarchaeota archaeon]|nr:MAG: hypothetical protein E6H31_08685 [Candidatus Bathyarchaeota archaeon]